MTDAEKAFVLSIAPCPLCGASNHEEELTNVTFTPHVWGNIGTKPPDLDPLPECWFAANQMVKCRICGCMLIVPMDALRKWTENRGCYSLKTGI